MFNVLGWLIAVEVMGLLAFPLCYYLFPRLGDRGFSVSKVLGLLIIGYLSWILTVFKILPSTQISIGFLLLIFGVLSGWYLISHFREFSAFFVREKIPLLISEALFILVFLGWVIYRAYDSSINHTEQPMDFMFLNALTLSSFGTPEDPWFIGESISYYYFGYWIMGILTKLTSIPTSVTYNLSLAIIPALAAMGIFGLVYNMIRSELIKLKYGIFGGIFAVYVLVMLGNLEGGLEFIHSNWIGLEKFWNWVEIEGLDGASATITQTWMPEGNWWWWRATRVISSFNGGNLVDYTIHEFPFFSFLLGDLHPHVMSLPFVVLFLSILWNFLRMPMHIWREKNLLSYSTIFIIGLCLGGLGFNNMWDLPVFSLILFGVVVIKIYSYIGISFWELGRMSLAYGSAAIGIGIILILPYLLTFNSQVSGISPVTEVVSRPLHLFIIWGLFLIIIIPFVVNSFGSTTVNKDWIKMSFVSLSIGFSPYIIWVFLYLSQGGMFSELISRLFHVFPFALLISMSVYSVMWIVQEKKEYFGNAYAITLVAIGTLLIMGPELFYVNDSFGGAWERMNTVFKLYYQAWIILAVAAGFSLYYMVKLTGGLLGWKLVLSKIWVLVFMIMFLCSSYYSLAATFTKGEFSNSKFSLDGLAFLKVSNSSEYMAIKYMSENSNTQSGILEAVGNDYTDFSRISGSTGIPTVLGWPGHQSQWRGSGIASENREQDVATIYRTLDVEEAKELLSKYDLDHVYVGSREKNLYGSIGIEKFSKFMNIVFQDDQVTIYKMSE